LYKPEEVKEFGETLKAVKKIVRKAYAYMNNHPNAQAIANALELKNLIKEQMPSDLHSELLKRYPELKAIVAPKEVRAAEEVPVRKR
jgi:uncharacterized protein YecE (DUF72 family)